METRSTVPISTVISITIIGKVEPVTLEIAVLVRKNQSQFASRIKTQIQSQFFKK